MVDFVSLSKIFWTVGAVISFILGITKLVRLFERPKIFLRPNLQLGELGLNDDGVKVLIIKYATELANEGKNISGKLCMHIEHLGYYDLSKLIGLKKNETRIIKGIEPISLKYFDDKNTEAFPLILELYFKNLKGRKYATHRIKMGSSGAYSYITTRRTID